MPDAGIIVDIEVVTGEASDFARMAERLDALDVTLDRRPETVTADKAYGIGKVCQSLSDRDIQAFGHPSNQWRRGLTPTATEHPTQPRPSNAKGFPTRRFRYDATHDVVRCPRRRVMTPRSGTRSGRWFRAGPDAPQGQPSARPLHPGWRAHTPRPYHRTLCRRASRPAQATGLESRRNQPLQPPPLGGEGAHGLAKTLHGMARAARRGLESMKIQALLTATAINLKRLAKPILLALIHASLNARNEQNIAA